MKKSILHVYILAILKFQNVGKETSDNEGAFDGETEGVAEGAGEASDQRECVLPLSSNVRGQVLPRAQPQHLQFLP